MAVYEWRNKRPRFAQTGAVIFLIAFLSHLNPAVCQGPGVFPQLINAAERKPISTAPPIGTCGFNPSTGELITTAFCRSSTLASSVTTCNQAICSQGCPSRTSSPAPTPILSPTSPCIRRDSLDVRPFSAVGATSHIFDAGCFISPGVVPTVGGNGRFTVSLWLKPDSSLNSTREGTLLEKRSSLTGRIIYTLLVSRTSVIFEYRTSPSSAYLISAQTNISPVQWTHLAVQVYDRKVSFFINGLAADGTALETQTLQGQMYDESNAQTRVGQRLTGGDQYPGRMQDFYIYAETLTNREIVELATGSFPEVHAQSDCRCPDSHPRVNPLDDRFCLRNGDPDTTIDRQYRLRLDAYPLEFANDGDVGSSWVSTFTDDIMLFVDLVSGEFQVFYVVLQFYSPQPRAVTISRRANDTADWEVWQYYADNCTTAFGMPNNGPLPLPTSINCLEFPTDPPIPYSKGNITFQLLSPEPIARPGYNDFYNTPALLEFVRATQIRVHLQNHYHITNRRHAYYGIEELTVSARCDCSGHAMECDLSVTPYQCVCLHNTMGDHCDSCLPLYNDKPFRHGDQEAAYACKPCTCYNHADRCDYNATVDPFPDDHSRGGGGVCIDCQHNTEGRHCDRCQTGYYREVTAPLDSPDVCRLCACYTNGTMEGSGVCDMIGGQCPCKNFTTGRQCDACRPGFYNLQSSNPFGCEDCGCQTAGTVGGDSTCHQETGVCRCKANVIGDKCDRCNYGFFNLSRVNPLGCQPCSCNPSGGTSPYCNPVTGDCQCNPGVHGRDCDQCLDGYFSLGPGGCLLCDCDEAGSVPGSFCNKTTGQCLCKANVEGHRCDQCRANSYNLQRSNPGGCSDCACNTAGTVNASLSCNSLTGTCNCKSLVRGRTCNQCRGNSWGLEPSNPNGCLACACNPTGTQHDGSGTLLGCDQNSGQCPCLNGRTGRQCDRCAVGYLSPDVGGGCLPCNCHPLGSVSNACNTVNGQCQCRDPSTSGVSGRQCDSCLPEFWNFGDLTGTCQLCNCNPAGSLNTTCEPTNGLCECKELVTGRRCDTCKSGTSNLQAGNPLGCSKAPEQQPAPSWSALTPFSLRLVWDPPDAPNGNILEYRLYRDGALVYSGLYGNDPLSTQEYNDTGLAPYTQYTYYVQAVNEAGTASSPPITATTPDAIPANFDVLTITNVGARTAQFSWSKPVQIVAPVTRYILSSVTPSQPAPPTQHYSGGATSYTANDLIPFTNYTFFLMVCTASDCGRGIGNVAYTPMAPPEGVQEANAVGVSTTAFFISWAPPTEPNGIITHYELFMRGLPGLDGLRDPPETRIFFPAGYYNPRPTLTPLETPAEPPATNFTQDGLEPFTAYEFKVTARNAAGTGESNWARARTLEAMPVFTPAPFAYGITSSQLNVTWQAPTERQALGFIVRYNLYQIVPSQDPFAPPEIESLIYTSNGTSNYFVVNDLQPYALHEFVVEACNSIGCVKSDQSSGRTLESVPEGLQPPSVDGYNFSTMSVTWDPPLQQNGPTPLYTAVRTVASFNSHPPRVEKGARFPGGAYYLFPSSTLPSSAYTGIEFEFRVERLTSPTMPVDALLLLAVSPEDQEEIVAIQLRNGRPWFLFDPQGGIAAVTPTNDRGRRYDDGQWHRVLAVRNGVIGTITVDGVYTGQSSAPTASTIIGVTTGLYVGGLPPDFVLSRMDTGNSTLIQRSFVGCMRGLRVERQHRPAPLWEDLGWEAAAESRNTVPGWQGCPMERAEGVHFLGRGYASLPEGTVTSGPAFIVTMEMRTQLSSGLIMFGYATSGAFFLLQLVNGDLELVIRTGAGNPVTLSTSGASLCDGQWRSLTLAQNGGQVSMGVLGGQQAVGSGDSTPLVVTSQLFVGGVPEDSNAMEFVRGAGLTLQSGFGGCMRQLVVSGQRLDFSVRSVQLSNVYLDGCPAETTTSGACMTPITTPVYTGQGTSFGDHGLQTYTEYLYRVTATNNAGSTTSSWVGGRTREGPPTGVTPPTDPVALSGYIIQLSWQRPTGNTGLLLHYVLTAYDQDRTGAEPIRMSHNDTGPSEYTGNITDAIPFTRYAVTVTACTAGGCTESSSVPVMTLQEAPEGVNPPEATSTTADTIALAWLEPDRPNGVIISYTLRMNDLAVYTGLQQVHTESGLQVYTGYRFRVRACTAIGCTDSPEVSITTAQQPPTFVPPPTLLVRGPTSIEASWVEPPQLNGRLERYVLYLSVRPGQTGEEAYNSTVLVRSYVLAELTAGSTYLVTLSACTGGGCTNSAPATARTEESIPEGVPAPSVTVISPYELLVSWTPPENPNGIITRYTLIQDGSAVLSNLSLAYRSSGLAPHSLHIFRLEACTSRGCAYGPETSARTAEAPPVGSIMLGVFVTDARTVSARWTAPNNPNGILHYEVLFTGIFYVSPEMGNYNTISQTRTLLNTTDVNVLVAISGLIPDSAYTVQVLGYNTKGSLLSNQQNVRMPNGSPDGVFPPTLVTLSSSSIRAQWQSPARNNAPGDAKYQLQFRPVLQPGLQEDLFGSPVSVTSFTKTGLSPYTEYEFRVIASNNFGETESDWTAALTSEAAPGPIDPPMATIVDAYNMLVTWEQPEEPNGVITTIRLYQNNQLREILPGNATQFLADGLTPYTNYNFHVEMCNGAGCTSSLHSKTYRTPQAVPSGLAAPTLRSETPTSVLITWSTPDAPSGVLTSYQIQRRVRGSAAVTTVVSIGPASPLVYLDQSPAVTPYTVFEYRIRVSNGVGTSSSPWQTVTTLSAAPGGVNAPTVTILNHESALVTWQPPVHSNGDLISYTIRMPQPRVYIGDTNTTSRVVSGLVPYTNYMVTIEVCTIGGCTESSATPAQTDPYIPGGQAPPRGDAITQTYISVSWGPPTGPNGPNIRYELHRMKIRQPLQSGTPTGIGFWQLIYSGTQNFYADLGLTTYTTYQYRVTVSNDVGSLTSNSSGEVTTLAGRPSLGATLSAVALDHVTVSLTWTTPTLQELKGSVVNYFVEYGASSTPGVRTQATYLPGTNNATVGLLMPNTLYEFKVIIFNGAYNVSSNLAYAETQDGAPEGFAIPTITILSPSALRVSWQSPAQPNGDILRYKVYRDDTEVAMLPATTFSHILSDLRPYTIYKIQVEVCTVYDCLLSNATLTTTQEAPPTGLTPANLRVLGSSVIDVSWASPAQPNGIILQYEVYRRAYKPCDEESGPVTGLDTCFYLECSITESVCGGQCYSGNQVCCAGSLHNQRPAYECCGTNYLPARASSTDVCCGGQFHSYQANSQCCRGQYVSVPAGHICCSDPNENRVVVGAGDACCRGIPYDTSGPQICCAGSFYDKTQGLCCQMTFVPFTDTFQDGFNSQCCGTSVIGTDQVCCQENDLTMTYNPEPNKVCCGVDYVDPAVTLCCSSETGVVKAHSYPTPQAKQLANDQCCGAEKISPSQACCNSMGYNPLTHVCADRGTNVEGNCGGGTVCPISQAATAYCNKCDFDRNTRVCATVDGQYRPSPPPPTGTTPGDGGLCMTALDSVAVTGPNTYSYLDEDLLPYTTYEYAITAHNSVGSATSEFSSARTNEDIPKGVAPPDWRVGVGVLDTIILSWKQPAFPNGVITTYILRRDNIEIYRGLDTSLEDSRGIQPYQHYTYVLGACTSVGCANSEAVITATLQDAPANLFDPAVTSLDANTIQITWREPGRPNGVIQEYRIRESNAADPIYVGDATVFEYVHRGLQPYTSYQYTLVACTAAGCTSSNPVSITTPEAPPQGVSSPVHVVISATMLELYWSPPTTPNGIITSYQLYRFNQLVYSGGNSGLMFTDTNLTPNTRYEYTLRASTSAGGTNSSVYACQTPESSPEGIPTPSLTVLSSSSIRATWQAPVTPNGVIRRYGAVILSGTPEQRPYFSGLATSLVISNLTPFRLYDIRVEACNDGGCGHGPKAFARTFEAPPQGQGPPTLVASGATVVEVSWDPPTYPNGNITRYMVHRRQYGTNQLYLVYQGGASQTSFVNAGGGLSPFTLFEYRVTVYNSEGMDEGPWANVRTLEAPPQGVAQPELVAISSYAIQASWGLTAFPNGLITAYRLEYQEISNDPTLPNPVVPAATVEGSLFQTTFYGLSPFTSYQVRIVAINGAGETAGPWGQVTTQEGVPAEIGQFTVVQQSDGRSLVLRWPEPGQPNGHIREYRIYEDVYLITPIYIGLTREYLFRRLEPYTEYVVVLEACTSIGCGRGEPQSVVTAEVAPENQAPPTLGEVTSTSVQLIWSPPVSANGRILRYDIVRRTATSSRRRRDTDSSLFTDTRVVHQEYNTQATQYNFTDFSLQPHKLYEYRVMVVNSIGQAQSPWVSVRTEQAPPVGLLSPVVSHVANDPTTLQIQWSAPSQANGVLTRYLLRRNESAPFSFETPFSFEHTDQGLVAYTVYAYTITACTDGGCTESDPTYVRTLETAPGNVAPPVAAPISSSSIHVSWTSPSLDAGEIIRYELKIDGAVTYSGSGLEHTATALIPYREYSFTVAACTIGGCTESLPTLSRPFEAPPVGMNSPVLRALSAIAVEASWTEPDMPNGLILRYELRRDGKLVYDGAAMRFQDFGDGGRGLTPGQEYSYVVTAFNSQGQAISDPATVLTSSSSPAGLNSPELTVLTSSSIRATWLPPIYPNGEIQNYTLYVEGNIIYSGKQFSFDVQNLDFFTEYEFRIGACTSTGCALSDRAHARTLENAPTSQLAPTLTPLTDNLGVASGVLAEWGLPQNPNGRILDYKLYRRRFYRQTNTRDDPLLIYEGPNTRYTDGDSTLIPDKTYEYMVTSRNSVGETSSSWAVVRMLEAPPDGLQPPQLTDVGATSLTVNILAPSQPNGDILSYTIIRNGTELIITTLTSYPDGQLQPYTVYAYSVKACTAGGCTTSEQATIQTSQALPSGLAPPTVSEVGTTWAHVGWALPAETNGIIVRYELHMRASCPPTSQPFTQTCTEAGYQTLDKALLLSHNATGLQPYTNYEFMVKAYNTEGPVQSPPTVQATLGAAPEYIPEIKPAILTNATSMLISVSWVGSFRLNSMLTEYQLTENGDVVYSGTATGVKRPLKAQKYEWTVMCRTTVGSVSYPTIIYQPPDSPGATQEPLVAWYTSPWFIALIVLVGVVILFILIGVLLSRTGPLKPYERERRPLPPRQRRGNFTFNTCGKFSETESILDPIPQAISRSASMHSLRNAYTNPTFLDPGTQPASYSRGTTPEKLKQLDDSVWDSRVLLPKPDSGMGFEEDTMTHISQPYSYTKEQTMFTDTHL
ncbi:usherin-like isoform X2 [Acanthaster planci]|uniref:Usherin-like isoform X2 n=1 Tax=Acanthaster planci TaxID=133434 RepID=A0A8B7Z1C3_ACAPL|nr:usherin-like isoform X2 [Acanthaster planci]